MQWSEWRNVFHCSDRDDGACPRDEVPTHLHRALIDALACLALGETGEGRIAASLRRWDHPGLGEDYHAALAAFLAEEGRHAKTLRAWVRSLGGEVPATRWSATLFRHARRSLGPRTEMAMLLAAEVIALVAYGALAERLPRGRFATAIAGIARDEATHLAFHVEFFRAVLGPIGRRLFALAWWPLATGAALAAWAELGGLLAALGVAPGDLSRRAGVAIRWVADELAHDHCGSAPLPSRMTSISSSTRRSTVDGSGYSAPPSITTCTSRANRLASSSGSSRPGSASAAVTEPVSSG